MLDTDSLSYWPTDQLNYVSMPKRIYDQYAPGDEVEIIFGKQGEAEWQPAVVVRRKPPGIWVRTADGREWFMTNTYRIRPIRKEESKG
jgi:hypothetical protein